MIDKSLFKDDRGRFYVQSLFLEDSYDVRYAVFTFDGEDKEYKDKTYISLKKRYLDWSDPTEYDFAQNWVFDWNHWQRLCNNKVIGRHIDEWRKELKLKLQAEGINTMINLATEQNSYQAAKYLAECGWDRNEKGRPSKEQIEGELKKRADEAADWNEDFQLLQMHKGDK